MTFVARRENLRYIPVDLIYKIENVFLIYNPDYIYNKHHMEQIALLVFSESMLFVQCTCI